MKVPEERACELAHVSRDTLRRYERGDWIATRSKRERLTTLYGMWRSQLLWSVDAGHHAGTADESSPRDADGEPEDVYSDTTCAQTLPPPPMSGEEVIAEALPPTLPSSRAA